MAETSVAPASISLEKKREKHQHEGKFMHPFNYLSLNAHSLVCSHDQGATGVRNVIDDNGVLAGNIAHQRHALHLVGPLCNEQVIGMRSWLSSSGEALAKKKMPYLALFVDKSKLSIETIGNRRNAVREYYGIRIQRLERTIAQETARRYINQFHPLTAWRHQRRVIQ